MEKSARTGRAGMWLFLRKVWAGVLNLFVISYLARILAKEDFGLIMIAGALINIVITLGPGAIGDYLVYKKNDEHRDKLINSAFWLNVLVIAIISLITLSLTPLWARWYGNPTIKPLVYILSLGFIGEMLLVIPLAILKGDLDFKPIIIVQTITGTVSQLSQLALALLGFGVYSLAIPTAVFPLIAGAYLMVKTRPKINFKFQIKYWKGIFSYVKYLMGSRILGRLTTDGDSLILGKILGITSLGVYNLSNKLASLLNQNLMPIMDDVALPVFSDSNDKAPVLKKQYLYITRLISLFLTPVYFLLIIFAPLVVMVLYGHKWMDAIIPLQILSVFSFVKSITYPTMTLYYALGKPKIEFYFTVFFTPLFIASVWFFAYKGLIISCITIALLRIVSVVYHVRRVGKLIDLSPFSFLKEIRHVLVPNILIGIAYFVVLHFVQMPAIKYFLLLMYVPIAFYSSYLFYKKSFLKDYLLLCTLFPGFRNMTTFGLMR